MLRHRKIRKIEATVSTSRHLRNIKQRIWMKQERCGRSRGKFAMDATANNANCFQQRQTTNIYHSCAKSAYPVNSTSSRPDFSTTKNSPSGSPSTLGKGCMDMTDEMDFTGITARLSVPEYVHAHRQLNESESKSGSGGPYSDTRAYASGI